MAPLVLRWPSRCVLVACSVALCGAPSAFAADIQVTTRGDTVAADGQCSLREAITAASGDTAFDGCTAGHGADRILLSAGRYPLERGGAGEDANSTGDLDLASAITLAGAGAGSTTIDAGGLPFAQRDRAIEIRPGGDVDLSDLAVIGGRATRGADGAQKFGLPGNPGETVLGGTGTVGADGGGILNRATLTLENVRVVGNRAGDGGDGGLGVGGSGGSCACNAGSGYGGPAGNGGNGGGVANFGTLVVKTSVIQNNVAGTGGRGGEGDGGGGGTFFPNVGNGGDGFGGSPGLGGWGGGIFNAGTLSVDGSSILTNSAGDGGSGNVGSGGAGAVTTANSGLDGIGDGSSASDGGFGGGIADSSMVIVPTMKITASTLAGNRSGAGGVGATGIGGGTRGNSFGGRGGDGGYGGALLVRANVASVVNSTLAGNIAGAGGGGAVAGRTTTGTPHDGADGTQRDGSAVASYAVSLALLQDTIAAGIGRTTLYLIAGSSTVTNSILAGPCGVNGSKLNDGGHDLASGAAGCPGAAGDPKLGPLADNGGATTTMALGAGSAALDKVPASAASCPSTDQRGIARPQFAACDIGAFELAPAPPPGQGLTGAPNLSAVTVAPASFAVGTKSTPKTAAKRHGVAKGTTIGFRLSKAAKVTLSFERRLAGLKLANKHGKTVCLAATGRRRHTLLTRIKRTLGSKASGPGAASKIRRALRKARCIAFASRGKLSRAELAGADKVPFSGRIGHRALARGRYRVRVTATDAAGNVSEPAAAPFTIVAG
jgi:CSLREA domain-containing protein